MSLSEIKEKTNWTHVVIGVSSSLLTLAIVAVVAVCFCGFRYRNIVLLNSEQVVKEEVQSTVTIPEAELLTQLHQKGILMTPAEYTGPMPGMDINTLGRSSIWVLMALSNSLI